MLSLSSSNQARAAAVGDGDDPLLGARMGTGQQPCRRYHLHRRLHAHSAGARNGRLEDAVVLGKHIGVGAVRFTMQICPVGLEHDHRLHSRDLANSRHEGRCVFHLFDVEQYIRGLGIEREIVQQLAEIKIKRCAQ